MHLFGLFEERARQRVASWARGAVCIFVLTLGGLRAGEVRVMADVPYKDAAEISAYETERCKLDLYLPETSRGFSTLVWIHGGSLMAGSKDSADTRAFGRRLASAGIAVANMNYRLSPRATFPAYIEDAAAAFAWVRAHIAEHGGEPRAVFLGGHSAGAYVAMMAGMDARYLQRHGLALDAIAGLVPVSGQTMTHYTVRTERGLDRDTIIADEAAPIHYARKGVPPLLVLWAENDLPARAEENAYLVAALRAAGHERVEQAVMPNRDHGTIISQVGAADDRVIEEIRAFVIGKR